MTAILTTRGTLKPSWKNTIQGDGEGKLLNPRDIRAGGEPLPGLFRFQLLTSPCSSRDEGEEIKLIAISGDDGI
jgi:hypothetical protein